MSRRSVIISGAEHGRPLATVLQQRLQLSLSRLRRLIHERQVRVGGVVCRNPSRQVRKGQRVEVELDAAAAPPPRKTAGRTPRAKRGGSQPPAKAPAAAKRPSAKAGSTPHIRIRYLDQHIVVVDKPAGLTTVRHAGEAAEFGERGQKFLPATLADLLPAEILRQKHVQLRRVRAVHRLDRDTTGLVVFACTPAAERKLGQALRQHEIHRRYLALVRGQPQTETIESHFIAERGDGRRGSSADGSGQRAVTHVRVLEQFGEYGLVECTLETGRTHQVRIHLGERGTPLCGERIYDRPLHGAPYLDNSGATRPLLHAAGLELQHPATGERLTWSAPLPADMKEMLARLRDRPAPAEE